MIREFNNELQAKAIADSLGLVITKYKGVYIVSNNREEIYNSFRYNLGYYDEGDIFYDKELFKISDFLFLAIKNKNIVDASSIELPYGIKNCSQMFMYCTSLKVPPIIPEGVEDCSYMFIGCTSLEIPPNIPERVKDCTYMFCECTSLRVPPKIPESVINRTGIFDQCTSLKLPPEDSEDLRGIFSGCGSLKEPPHHTGMFDHCTSLEMPPEASEELRGIFHGCTSLKTPTHFPENCDTYEALFNTPFNRKQV